MTHLEKRIKFTQSVADLIKFASDQGYEVILDWALRSAVAQKELYDKGASKCDGYNTKSQHQRGLAVDIYIMENGQISEDEEKYNILHQFWEDEGGQPIIVFSNGNKDLGHFEMR